MCPMVWQKKVNKTTQKSLTLKINLSHAICNSKNEDIFFLMLFLSLFSTFLLCQNVKAGLLKSSKTLLTPVTIFSVYCHLGSASGGCWQKLRDWGGASSLRPSGSLTQTQSHKHLQDSLLTVKHPYSHHPYCCFVYIPGTTPFAHPPCTSLLFILLFIKSQYTVFYTSYCFALCIPLHILLLFLFFYHIYV